MPLIPTDPQLPLPLPLSQSILLLLQLTQPQPGRQTVLTILTIHVQPRQYGRSHSVQAIKRNKLCLFTALTAIPSTACLMRQGSTLPACNIALLSKNHDQSILPQSHSHNVCMNVFIARSEAMTMVDASPTSVAGTHTSTRSATSQQCAQRDKEDSKTVLHGSCRAPSRGNAMSRGCRCSGLTAPLLLCLPPGKGGQHQIKAARYGIVTGFSPSGRRQLRFVRFGPDLVRDLASLSRSMIK